MILPIKIWPDPVLLRPCETWNPGDTVGSFADDLVETMLAEGGIGLAANQVGVNRRVMAMWVQETNERLVLFNPELVEQSQDLLETTEGCLSFPRIELTIARPRTVTVRYQDRNQVWVTATFCGIDARCFLHELDHLNGKTFRDYVSPLKFGRAIDRARKR